MFAYLFARITMSNYRYIIQEAVAELVQGLEGQEEARDQLRGGTVPCNSGACVIWI